MATHKAPGLDGLTDLHIKQLRLTKNFDVTLMDRLNSWLKNCAIPKYVKTARIITLSKDATNFPKYGQIKLIAILPTFYKLFEQIILPCKA